MSTRKKDDAEIQQYKTMLLNVVECIQYKEDSTLSIHDQQYRIELVEQFKGRIKNDIEKTIHAKTKDVLMSQKLSLEKAISMAVSGYTGVSGNKETHVKSAITGLVWTVIRSHIKKSQKYWVYVQQYDNMFPYAIFTEYKNVVINYDNIQKHLKSLLEEENVGADLQSSNRVSKSRKQNKVQEDKS